MSYKASLYLQKRRLPAPLVVKLLELLQTFNLLYLSKFTLQFQELRIAFHIPEAVIVTILSI